MFVSDLGWLVMYFEVGEFKFLVEKDVEFLGMFFEILSVD